MPGEGEGSGCSGAIVNLNGVRGLVRACKCHWMEPVGGEHVDGSVTASARDVLYSRCPRELGGGTGGGAAGHAARGLTHRFVKGNLCCMEIAMAERWDGREILERS